MNDRPEDQPTLPPEPQEDETFCPDTVARSSSCTDLPLLGSFGGYEVLQEIARGGMGVVYKARDTKLNRIVALKMIRSGQLASPDDRTRFQLEAEAAAKLDHPGITPIYEIGEHEGQPFFVMKLIEGGSLADHLNEYVGEPRKAARLVRDIARAVHHAHQRATLHRDLKPNNILLDEEGKPLVTDFGLAKMADRDSGMTQTGAIIGTPGYMPPEQAASGKNVTTAADIYSLGAILFATLTGRPPFQGDTPMATVMQVVQQDAPKPTSINSKIPIELELICTKCLSRAPEDRYASADEFAGDLENWLSGDPVSVRPPNLGSLTWKLINDNFTKIGIAIGCGVASGLLAAPLAISAFMPEHTVYDSLPSVEPPSARALVTLFSSLSSMMSSVLLIPFVGLLQTLLGVVTVVATQPREKPEAVALAALAGFAGVTSAFLLFGWLPIGEILVAAARPDLNLLSSHSQSQITDERIRWRYPDLASEGSPRGIVAEKIETDLVLNSAWIVTTCGLLFSLMLVPPMTSALAYVHVARGCSRRVVRVLRLIEIGIPAIVAFTSTLWIGFVVWAFFTQGRTIPYLIWSLLLAASGAWLVVAWRGRSTLGRLVCPFLVVVAFALGSYVTSHSSFDFKDTAQNYLNGDFALAARQFERKFRVNRNPYWLVFASVHYALAKERHGYERVCSELDHRITTMGAVSSSNDPNGSHTKLIGYALHVSIATPGKPSKSARHLHQFLTSCLAPEECESEHLQYSLALFKYREGDYTSALELLDKVADESLDANAGQQKLVLQAMIFHQAGERERASVCYQRAKTKPAVELVSPLTMHFDAVSRLVTQEAAELLGEGNGPARE